MRIWTKWLQENMDYGSESYTILYKWKELHSVPWVEWLTFNWLLWERNFKTSIMSRKADLQVWFTDTEVHKGPCPAAWFPSITSLSIPVASAHIVLLPSTHSRESFNTFPRQRNLQVFFSSFLCVHGLLKRQRRCLR